MSPRAAWRLESLGFRDVHVYAAGKADWGAMGLPLEGALADRPTIGALARTDVPTCALTDRVRDLREWSGEWDTCLVVNEARVVLGRILTSELSANGDARAEEVMRPGPSTFRPNVSVAQMLEYMREHDLRSAPVTRGDGTLVGLVLRSELEAAEVTARASREKDMRVD
ncbi:MAG: CBS domain-containing protein [Chloroflexi bacterium]|nr:MAG: CBS domain-containing protein [Chloroflexota bacterium]TMB93717.1 MAG: CBS domain-containing protein [Chloroflexota bacterium]TMC28660.1 MAG: CBS domain-containing protein [Chloroflexota bacterium]TMC32177.1 MAG: CBS domain-containing protein [Chloroflexota bacterium]TMC57285.1 MAG: CBS domain-containing protein [Chloroflexota bacterium]